MATYLAWTATNGKLNVQPVPTGQPVTLDQSSNQGPALAFYKNRLYLAWTGTDGKLNVISSANGTKWEDQATLGQSSNNSPALIASSNLLSLVWTGTNGQINLIFSSNGKDWDNQVTLSQSSGLAPASALGPFQDQAVAWTDGDGVLNAVCGMGIAGRAQGAVLDGTSKTGPALTFYNGLLFVAFTDRTNGNLTVISTPDGVTGRDHVILDQQTTNNAPALTGSTTALFLAWTGTDNQLRMSSSADGRRWESPTPLSRISKLAPAITVSSF